MKRSLSLLVAAAAILLAACASGGASSRSTAPLGGGSMGGMDGMDGPVSSRFGQPGDPTSVDRTVDVGLLDSLAFDPSSMHAETGETIRFRVTNTGEVDHEFVLGDEATQGAHAAQMGSDGSMHMDESNLLTVEPGETRSLLWTFAEPGTVLYGCHVPGHYAGGMVGSIMVM
ncbi:MAG: plastocyanin/azurin family copper-binding protein [Actinomycetota bacterium]